MTSLLPVRVIETATAHPNRVDQFPVRDNPDCHQSCERLRGVLSRYGSFTILWKWDLYSYGCRFETMLYDGSAGELRLMSNCKQPKYVRMSKFTILKAVPWRCASNHAKTRQ